MKIISETPSILILKENAYSVILGGIIAIITSFILAIVIFSNSPQPLTFLIPLVFLIVGIITILSAKLVIITINKSINKINLSFVGLLGKKTQDIDINQVSEVVIQENYGRSMSSNNGNTTFVPHNTAGLNFTLVFYLKNGEGYPIPMGTANSGLSINRIPFNIFSVRNKQIELGNKIASFIGVPFKDNRPPTLSDMVGAIGQVINQSQQTPPPPNNQPPIINN